MGKKYLVNEMYNKNPDYIHLNVLASDGGRG